LVCASALPRACLIVQPARQAAIGAGTSASHVVCHDEDASEFMAAPVR
jgi:hypothetical protein